MSKKVLFIGMGSAGQRHLRNLTELLGGQLEIAAYRRHKSERVFTPAMQVIENETLAERYKIQEFDDYEKALNEKPDFVVIANPNSMHLCFALSAAKRGIDLFIEKPLSSSVTGTQELISTIDNSKVICQVGFQYRYHPCLQMAKAYLSNRRLGDIVSVSVEVGERLSEMHNYEDYRDMIEARAELGGGVILCQCHELDYMAWFFGEPDTVYSSGGRRSGFDIDVEDTATSLFQYRNKYGEFAAVVHQDFLQYPPVRTCKIIGTRGRIEIDLLRCKFIWEDWEAKMCREEKFQHFDRNNMFIDEMRDFLRCLESREPPVCSARTALSSLRIGAAIKESILRQKEIKLNDMQ